MGFGAGVKSGADIFRSYSTEHDVMVEEDAPNGSPWK